MEEVIPRDLEILRAGITKLKSQAERFLLLDITGAKVRKDAAFGFMDVQIEGYRLELDVIIISKLPIGHAPTRDDGLAFMKSQKNMDTVHLAILKRWIPMLMRKDSVQKAKLQEYEGQGIDLAQLKMKERKVSFVVQELVSQVENFLEWHRDPLNDGKLQKKLSEIGQLIRHDLQEQTP